MQINNAKTLQKHCKNNAKTIQKQYQPKTISTINHVNHKQYQPKTTQNNINQKQYKITPKTLTNTIISPCSSPQNTLTNKKKHWQTTKIQTDNKTLTNSNHLGPKKYKKKIKKITTNLHRHPSPIKTKREPNQFKQNYLNHTNKSCMPKNIHKTKTKGNIKNNATQNNMQNYIHQLSLRLPRGKLFATRQSLCPPFQPYRSRGHQTSKMYTEIKTITITHFILFRNHIINTS